jgi:Ni,Fe-hydrogenase I cytochrome b subunit
MNRKPLSFFKNVKDSILKNDTLRFLFFVEKKPRHRVMDNISVLFLVFVSFGCFLAGLAGFVVLEYYTLAGFLLYHVGLLVALLESLHLVFDR